MAEQERLEQLENLLKENYKKLSDLDRRQKEVEESKETKTSKQSILRSIRHERSNLKKEITSLSVEKSKIEFPECLSLRQIQRMTNFMKQMRK